MISRTLLKNEIDKVQDEHLIALYRIIKMFELPLEQPFVSDFEEPPSEVIKASEWGNFIRETYGCLKDDPIERAPQGEYEIREEIE